MLLEWHVMSTEIWGMKIRIYQECESRIEKSVLKITVWYHKACWVMMNGDPEGSIFLSCPHKNNGLFLLLVIEFYSKISFQKFRCNINWWCHFKLKVTSLDDHEREFHFNNKQRDRFPGWSDCLLTKLTRASAALIHKDLDPNLDL